MGQEREGKTIESSLSIRAHVLVPALIGLCNLMLLFLSRSANGLGYGVTMNIKRTSQSAPIMAIDDNNDDRIHDVTKHELQETEAPEFSRELLSLFLHPTSTIQSYSYNNHQPWRERAQFSRNSLLCDKQKGKK